MRKRERTGSLYSKKMMLLATGADLHKHLRGIMISRFLSHGLHIVQT
jgi:hypothetical protein